MPGRQPWIAKPERGQSRTIIFWWWWHHRPGCANVRQRPLPARAQIRPRSSADQSGMNKLQLVFLIALTSGCLATQRNSNLGTCRRGPAGSYSCLIRIPKRLAGVMLIAKTSQEASPDGKSPWSGVKIWLRNVDSHSVEIQGLESKNVRLEPGQTMEVIPKSGIPSEAMIAFVDTSEVGVRLTVEILAPNLLGKEVRIIGHTSDAL